MNPSRPDGPVWPTVLLILVLAAPGASAADVDGDQKAAASAHLKRGAELIDAEDLNGALAEFQSAYDLVPSPSILHNFGVVYQGLGRNAAALDAFERFLAQAPQAPPATREHAQKALQALRPQVAELRVEADQPGAAIFVDGRNVGQTPQEKPIYLDPGPHQLSVEKAELTHGERLAVTAGQRVTVAARLARPPAPPPAAVVAQAATEPSPRPWQRPAAWAAAAGAVVAAGLFADQLVVHNRHANEFNAHMCSTRRSDPTCDDLRGPADRAQTRALASGVAAGALGVGAAILFFTLPAPGGTALSLRASRSELGLGLHGGF